MDGRRKAAPDARSVAGKCSVFQWRRRARDVQRQAGGWPWTRTTAASKTEVVGQIDRCSAVQALVNQCLQLESNALSHRQPMKWLDNRRNVVGAPGSSHHTRSCVLDWMQSLKLAVCNAVQQGIAVVEAAADEGVNQRIRRPWRQRLNNTSQLAQPEIAGTANGGRNRKSLCFECVSSLFLKVLIVSDITTMLWQAKAHLANKTLWCIYL